MYRPPQNRVPRLNTGSIRFGRPGFSLVEIMLAVSVTAIITALSAKIVGDLLVNMKNSEKRTRVDQEIKLLQEYLGSTLQQAGGGSVRPWNSIKVEDDWNGDGSDRLTLYVSSSDSPECSVNTIAGVNLRFGNTPCCLDTDGDRSLDPPIKPNMSVIVITDSGHSYLMTAHNCKVQGSNCRCNFPNGQQAYGNTLRSMTGTPQTMVFGTVQRYFLDTNNHVLKYEADTDADGTMELYDITDNVFDLQFALGFDANHNGQVLNQQNGSDEWLYNHATDSTNADGSLTGSQFSEMRMLGIGVTLGVPVRKSNNQVTLFNRPAPVSNSGWLLRGSSSMITLRNLNVFY